MMNWIKKVDALSAKYGLKVVEIWTDRWGHKSRLAYDKPSMGLFKNLKKSLKILKKLCSMKLKQEQ
jgi:hypothetical protein